NSHAQNTAPTKAGTSHKRSYLSNAITLNRTEEDHGSCPLSALHFPASTMTAGTKRTYRDICYLSRDQSLVDARDRSFQSAPCFCQFIRIWRLVLLFLLCRNRRASQRTPFPELCSAEISYNPARRPGADKATLIPKAP